MNKTREKIIIVIIDIVTIGVNHRESIIVIRIIVIDILNKITYKLAILIIIIKIIATMDITRILKIITVVKSQRIIIILLI